MSAEEEGGVGSNDTSDDEENVCKRADGTRPRGGAGFDEEGGWVADAFAAFFEARFSFGLAVDFEDFDFGIGLDVI